jgi:hypothetical protein
VVPVLRRGKPFGDRRSGIEGIRRSRCVFAAVGRLACHREVRRSASLCRSPDRAGRGGRRRLAAASASTSGRAGRPYEQRPTATLLRLRFSLEAPGSGTPPRSRARRTCGGLIAARPGEPIALSRRRQVPYAARVAIVRSTEARPRSPRRGPAYDPTLRPSDGAINRKLAGIGDPITPAETPFEIRSTAAGLAFAAPENSEGRPLPRE